jgi:hypothetical protein
MRKTRQRLSRFGQTGKLTGPARERERLCGGSGSLFSAGSSAGFAPPRTAIFWSVAKTQPSVKVLGPRIIAIETAVMSRINAPAAATAREDLILQLGVPGRYRRG